MINPTDPALSEIKAELIAAIAAVRVADADAKAARWRRTEALQRARAFGLTHGDIGRFVGVTRQQVHAWNQTAYPPRPTN